MASLFRTPTLMLFLDEDNKELTRIDDVNFVPRVGENVQVKNVPYLVERVGYDVVAQHMQRVIVICRPA